MSNKTIGSKLAESLRQIRSHPPVEATVPRDPGVTTPPAAAQPVPATTPRAAEHLPAASHGMLHPRRIWPD